MAGKTMSHDTTNNTKPQDNSYSVFNAVDAAVAKNVMGSDGAANWQDFRTKIVTNSSSAPKAPLKALDRAAGFTSWDDEVKVEERSRAESGARSLHSGYEHFKESIEVDGITAKERRRIRDKRLGSHQEYFIPSGTFQGWKWDYVFTTRPPRGTGYYFDGTDSLLELEGKRKRPIAAVDTTITEPLKKKKKEKKTKESVEIVRDANHPLEQVKALLHSAATTKQDDTLPKGWESALDASSKRTYYFHRATGERRWERPSAEWQPAKDPSTGKTYYYHTKTGETSWEKPKTVE